MESVIGIDAGGSRIRAIAVRGDAVVHRGSGGPGNPHTVPVHELAAHYSSALEGCPPARAAVVCAAGAGPVGSERLRRVLAPTLGEARLTVLPDYAAAWSAAPARTDIVVIAGTGSVIASRRSAEGYEVTGGAGVAGGDPGSAEKLGRIALEHAGLDAGGLPRAEAARHAERLTRAAEAGEAWALQVLRAEMTALADDVHRHAARIGRSRSRFTVAATGGVFRSPAAVAAFDAALGSGCEAVHMRTEPVMGAVRIARELPA